MVYIIICKDGIGGAEKRFVGLWLHLQRTGHRHVVLLISRELRQKLGTLREFAELASFDDSIRTFDSRGGLRSLRALLLHLWLADRRSVFHFIHVPPPLVQRFPSRRTVYSMTAATWKFHNMAGLLTTYAGMVGVQLIDVLNESVWTQLRRTLFWRRQSILLTPNSFVDSTFYQPAPYAAKRNRLTFLGTFTRDKGIFRLVELLPEIDDRLRNAGYEVEYRLLGRDVEHPGIQDACSKLRPRIDVEAYEEANPVDVLASSKVFLSLQQTTNYPSKSLLEALSCGALPIVTDVPESRRIAPDTVASYVPREFTAADIAEESVRIFGLAEAEFALRVRAARDHLRANFSLETMAAHYLDLYRRAGA